MTEFHLDNDYKSLFEFQDLKFMLVANRKIKETATEEEVYFEFSRWLDEQKDFRRAIKQINEQQKKEYVDLIKNEIKECKNRIGSIYSFNLNAVILKDYFNKHKIKLLEEKTINKLHDKPFTTIELKKLSPLTFSEFIAIEDKKEYYVKNMFAKGTINMIFSPPASMKSFISYYLGLCLATGTQFLNIKTKQVNVGYFDWENPISDVKNRVLGICKGMNIECSKINNFYFYSKQPNLLAGNNYESYVIEDLRVELLNYIKEKDIKVLFFDTLRRLGNFDENDSKSINVIKSELFDYLIKETQVCIIFLHHTSKAGENYRGSVDIEGILDTAYFVQKRKNEELLNLTIKNTKRRNNEIETLNCIVDIKNESLQDEDGEMYEKIIEVKFEKSVEKDDDSNNATYKEYIRFLKEKLEIGKHYKNKDITDLLINQYQIATKTSQRILDWNIDKGIIQAFGEKGTKNRYYSINPSSITKDETLIMKDIENHLKNCFKESDLVSLELLKSKFEEQYFNLVLNKWNKKAWINNAKAGYLGITELYRAENDNLNVDIVEMEDF